MSLPCAPTAMRVADLARPLGHTHEHDVHDSDSADHERDAGDCTEQQRHHRGGGGGCLRDFLLIAHGEIVIAAGANIMSLSKQRDDLLLRGLEMLSASAICTLMFRKVVPPTTRFIALVYGMITTSS